MAFTVVFTAELAVTAYAHWFRRGPAPAAGSRAWLALRLGRFVPFGSSICVFRLVDLCLSARRFVPFALAAKFQAAIHGIERLVDSCLSRCLPRCPRCVGHTLGYGARDWIARAECAGLGRARTRVIGSRAPNARDWIARARADEGARVLGSFRFARVRARGAFLFAYHPQHMGVDARACHSARAGEHAQVWTEVQAGSPMQTVTCAAAKPSCPTPLRHACARGSACVRAQPRAHGGGRRPPAGPAARARVHIRARKRQVRI